MKTLTWDGRVFLDAKGSVHTPQTSLLVSERAALEFGPLSALPMFPVLSRPEMRGTGGNELAAIADNQPRRTWRFLMMRLGAIPEYRAMFEAAYPGQRFDDMNFAHAGNAMGAWIAGAFASTNSPWDRFLAGRDDALTDRRLRGAQAFLGAAKCSMCHNGPLLSDGKFHNVAVPQVGPGFGNGLDGHDRLRPDAGDQQPAPPLPVSDPAAPERRADRAVRPRRRHRGAARLGGPLQRVGREASRLQPHAARAAAPDHAAAHRDRHPGHARQPAQAAAAHARDGRRHDRVPQVAHGSGRADRGWYR